MTDTLLATGVRLTNAAPRDERRGLVGYVSCVLTGSVRLDGLTLPWSRAGRPAISFPTRADAHGRSHPVILLFLGEDGPPIVGQIFHSLGIRPEAAP